MKSSASETPDIRLQTFISRSGVCSRRRAMEVVQQGRVTVNGQVITEPSTPVRAGQDTVCLDGKPVAANIFKYILLHKPAGVVTTKSDRFAEKTVIDLLPQPLKHLHPVGRLDKDTEGLLLLTNDGELTHRLTHPKFDVDKTYAVRIDGRLTEDQRRRLEKGVVIEDQKTAPAKISHVHGRANGTEFLMAIHEGRKRQIRLMLKSIGHMVTALKRIRQGPLELGSLPVGKFRDLTPDEVKTLKAL